MFDDFLKNCRMEDEIKPSEERVEKNIASVKSLIAMNDTEENNMTKRKFRFKPLIIAAFAAIISLVSLFVVNADMQGVPVKFSMGGEEIEGKYYDYVDRNGYRHFSFEAVMPLYEENFAIIFDVDAPQGENVRVITDDSDPDFMNKLRQYKYVVSGSGAPVNSKDVVVSTVDPVNAEDFDILLKDSELCIYRLGFISKYMFNLSDGSLGGKFMHSGDAEGHRSGIGEGDSNECRYDWENETKYFKVTFYYYVGK